jgi:hypothetical protein
VVRDAGVKVPVGAEVSMTTDRELDVADKPFVDVSVTVTVQVPSPSVANVQPPEERVQVTLVDPAFAAVITPVPESVPETENVGVLSLVKLSVEDVPKSEEVARSGIDGVATVVLIFTVETAEIFPDESFTTT